MKYFYIVLTLVSLSILSKQDVTITQNNTVVIIEAESDDLAESDDQKNFKFPNVNEEIYKDTLYGFENEDDEIRFNNLIKDIRCPKCTSGSLSSSNAPISEDLKLKIVEMIKENKTNQEINDYVTLRFGKESLYEPVFNQSTYILWFAPFIVLFLALLIFVFRKQI